MTDAAAGGSLRSSLRSPQDCAARCGRGRRLFCFSYRFDLTDARNADDIAIEKDGATVLIDEMSLIYMGGLGDRLRRRPHGPVVPDQEPERRGLLRLRHEFFGLTCDLPAGG